MGTLKGKKLCSEKFDPAQIQIHLRFYACPHYLQVWQRSDPLTEKSGDIVFPIVCQWELSVAMVTTVLIQSAPKPKAAFPPPKRCYW